MVKAGDCGLVNAELDRMSEMTARLFFPISPKGPVSLMSPIALVENSPA